MIGNERTREMRRLYDVEGMTLRDIGVRFEISAERVRQLLQADGYTPRPSRFLKIKEPVEYEVEVTRIQTKTVVVSAISSKEARKAAPWKVNWKDGLPMRTVLKISKPVKIDP